MDRTHRTRHVLLLAAFGAATVALRAQQPELHLPITSDNAAPGATAPTALHFSWTDADHLSGIYHAKSPAHLTLLLDNTSNEPLPVAGQILFGTREPPTAPPDSPADPHPADTFKTLSVTPITPVTLQPGQRARIPLNLAFAAAGTYELRFANGDDQQPILNPAGVPLECIFAPRPAASDTPAWLMPLPKAAVAVPGLLSDTITQTSVHRFLVDEHFAFDPDANLGLSFGASLGPAADVNTLFAETAKAKAALILRVTLPADADPRTVAAFQQYLTDALQRARGTLRAMALIPDPQGDPAAYRTLYLAAYATIKHADKSIQMLGAGSAAATAQLLLAQHLDAYIDALAITDAVSQAAIQTAIEGPKRPLWVLPPAIPDPWSFLPPAAALAQGAAVIPLPPPQVDRGVTAHLLGGAVFFQHVILANAIANRTDPAQPPFTSELPFIAVFQGDGYAVAAIAGFSAGTPLDARYPAVARARTVVKPVVPPNFHDPSPAPAASQPAADDPAYPNLEVGDDTHTMRAVDAQGSPLDCRVGDTLYLPATDKIVYLLQAGPADALAGSLRAGNIHGLPLFELTLTPTAAGNGCTARLHNITPRELAGKLRLLRPATSPSPASSTAPAQLLAETNFPAIPPGESLELPLDLAAQTLPADVPVIVETTTTSPAFVQRTALTPEPAR